MANRRSRRASRKSQKRSMRRHKKSSKRSQRSRRFRGGEAPIAYSLAGSWPSKMSMGQGTDYESYHVGQHGGSAPFPAAVSGTTLIPTNMNGSAMVDGTLRAYADVAGLRDPPFDSMPVATQKGAGRRRRGTRKGRKGSRKAHKGSKKARKGTQRHRKQKRRMRGGAELGFASVNTPGMLLASQSAYNQAGLNPGYITGGLEAQMAAQRGDKN